MLRAVLRVTRKDGYDWVECNGCDMGWQGAHYVEGVGGRRTAAAAGGGGAGAGGCACSCRAGRRGLRARLMSGVEVASFGSEPLLRIALGQYGRDMVAKPYDEIDPSVLKALPHPGGAIELKHKAPE